MTPKYKVAYDVYRGQTHFVYIRTFLDTMTKTAQNLTIKVKMVYMEFEPGTAGWQAQTNPLCYDGPLNNYIFHAVFLNKIL